MRMTTALMILLATGFPYACSPPTSHLPLKAQAPQSSASDSTLQSAPEADADKISESSGTLRLRTLRDVPLSGSVSRFDYQSFDPNTGATLHCPSRRRHHDGL